MSKSKPERVTGLRHLYAATTYSVAGVQRLTQESAFRQELLGLPVVLAIFVFIGAELWCFAAFTILWFLLIATEALNTSLEVLVDHLSPEWSQFAKDAKDLGSLAVMCLLFANGTLIAYVAYVTLFSTQ